MSSPSRSGAFDSAVDKRVERFTESISFDQRLFRHDIAGSIAHAHMLADQQILTEDERNQIENNLNEILQELENGTFEIREELEDIHMNIEQALIDRIGDVGRKLHTGRSRNDQVSTDLRLWVRAAIDQIDGLLENLQTAFVSRCDQDSDLIIPAYTHLHEPNLCSRHTSGWLIAKNSNVIGTDWPIVENVSICAAWEPPRWLEQLYRSIETTSLNDLGSMDWLPIVSTPPVIVISFWKPHSV